MTEDKKTPKRSVQEVINNLTPEDKDDIIALMKATTRDHPWEVEEVPQTLEIGLRLHFDLQCDGCGKALVGSWENYHGTQVPCFVLLIKPCGNCTVDRNRW